MYSVSWRFPKAIARWLAMVHAFPQLGDIAAVSDTSNIPQNDIGNHFGFYSKYMSYHVMSPSVVGLHLTRR